MLLFFLSLRFWEHTWRSGRDALAVTAARGRFRLFPRGEVLTWTLAKVSQDRPSFLNFQGCFRFLLRFGICTHHLFHLVTTLLAFRPACHRLPSSLPLLRQPSRVCSSHLYHSNYTEGTARRGSLASFASSSPWTGLRHISALTFPPRTQDSSPAYRTPSQGRQTSKS